MRGYVGRAWCFMTLHGMGLRGIGVLFLTAFMTMDAQEKHSTPIRWNGHALFIFVCCDDKMGWVGQHFL